MTALNVLVRPDRVHVLTDGAVYTSSGGIVGAMSKVHIMAHLPAVISFRGPVYFWVALVAQLDRSGSKSFEELMVGIADAVNVSVQIGHGTLIPEDLQEISKTSDPKHVEVVAAGWSHQRGRPEAYLIDTTKAGGQPIPAPDGYFTPMEPALKQRLTVGGWNLYDERNDARALLDLMRCQREERLSIKSGGKIAPLGLFAQHTILTRQGVSSQIVERWPEDHRA